MIKFWISKFLVDTVISILIVVITIIIVLIANHKGGKK